MPAKARPTALTSPEVEAYLADVPEPARSTLEKLRTTLRALVPDAIEVISYGVPAFKLKKVVVGYGASEGHCALYAFSGSVLAPFADALKAYDTSKGTVRFPQDKPLPAALVKKIVLAKLDALTAQ